MLEHISSPFPWHVTCNEWGMVQNKKRIEVLVVEDDPTMLHFWSRFLTGIGISKIEILNNALEAITHLRQKTYQLLITDVHLKALNGFELAKVACKTHPDIEILLSTSQVTDLTRFNLTGCRLHLLHKPFSNLEEIKRIIQCMLVGDNVFTEADEDSFSDNEDYPMVTEWKL